MVAVIGAGPAGNFFSSQIDDDVHIFEEHDVVGKPVACTGILTDSVEKVTGIKKDLVVSKINSFKIIAPNEKSMYVKLKHPNRILDRARLDQWLHERAIDNGAKVHLGERFLGYKKEDGKYRIKTSKKDYYTTMLVGADGPNSSVAQAAGIFGNRKHRFGWQVRCEYPDLEEGVTEVRLDRGEFSWVVPEDDKIARVGLIGTDMKSLKEDYKKLMGDAKILEHQSGAIPLWNPRQKLQAPGEDVFILGDAAGMVKATTHGGILYGLNAGRLLASDKNTYEEKFRSTLGKELWISLKIRQMMNKMSDAQLNKMVEVCSSEKINRILASHDRDYPSKFMLKLAMEPKLWGLGLGVLKNYLLH